MTQLLANTVFAAFDIYLKDDPQRRQALADMITAGLPGAQAGFTIDEIFPHIHLRPIETDGKNFREGHHAEHREELAKVVHQAEVDKISRKIAFIKVPFAYSDTGVCASLS